MAFKNITFYSKTINTIASCVFGTYLLEGSVRSLLNTVIDLSVYEQSAALVPAIAVYVLAVMLICCVVELVRKNTLEKADPLLYNALMHIRDAACAKGASLAEYIKGCLS